MSVEVTFKPDNIKVQAEPGESILAVAERAGVDIPTGCLQGSCHACEVEIDDEITVCACITGIPRSKEKMTIDLYVDPLW
jgi:ferredoxin